MPQKKHKPEEIVAKLRQVDVLLSQGRPVPVRPADRPAGPLGRRRRGLTRRSAKDQVDPEATASV